MLTWQVRSSVSSSQPETLFQSEAFAKSKGKKWGALGPSLNTDIVRKLCDMGSSKGKIDATRIKCPGFSLKTPYFSNVLVNPVRRS